MHDGMLYAERHHRRVGDCPAVLRSNIDNGLGDK